MAITKTGASVIDLAGLIKETPGVLLNLLKATGRGLNKTVPVAKGISSATGAVMGPAVKGTAALGRAAYNKPKIALPLLSALGYGAYQLPRNTKKSIIHSNPQYNVTTARGARLGKDLKLPWYSQAFREIEYKNPQVEEYFDKKNIYF